MQHLAGKPGLRCSAALRLLIAGVALAGSCFPAAAAPDKTVTKQQSQLEALQDRLKKLDQAHSQTKKSRTAASQQLKTTEAAIAKTDHRLDELAQARNRNQNELSQLQAQSQQLELQIQQQQQQLARLLRQQYMNGEADSLRLLLSGDDPHQAARDLYYMQQLSQAKLALLHRLEGNLQEKQRLSAVTLAKRQDLLAIEQEQQQQHEQLQQQQRERQALLSQLSGQLAEQQREINTLKRNERRLSQLIDRLIEQAAAKAARERAARLARDKAAAAARASKAAPRNQAGAARKAPELYNEREPEPLAFKGNFSSLKGRLALPLKGHLLHRYGSRRGDGGGNWKGLFITAPSGSPVKALAPGRVVFADWLRGYGNLIILDHGNDWLSVYGNNQSLQRQVGDTLNGGEVIALSGSSGSESQSGLYFELRSKGQPIDPLGWVRLN